MATIYVSRNGNSHKLKLRDDKNKNPNNEDLTTGVVPNEIVEWRLEENSGLSEIIGIKESDPGLSQYKGSQTLLANGATRDKNGVWTATVVSSSPGKKKFQNYMIGYKIPDDDKEYWHDPKLEMKT